MEMEVTFCKCSCQSLYCIYLMHSLLHILLDCCKYLMVYATYGRWCVLEPLRMLSLTPLRDPLIVGMEINRLLLHRAPVSIEQLLASQNELMGVLVQNEARRGIERPQHH
jgi:hypothetical protein